MSAEYLIIGHVTQDLTRDGLRPGGTAYYSAVTAQRLGYEAAVLTRAPHEMNLRSYLPDVHLHLLPAEQATTFENHYRGSERQQVVRTVAAPILVEDLPTPWSNAPIVHLAPIAQEVDRRFTHSFPRSILGVTPQGWLRSWNEDGRVEYQPLVNPETLLGPVDVLIFSAEDVAHDPRDMRQLIHSVPISVVTRAAEGVVVYTQKGAFPVPARSSHVVDPTGAGDVFAAAFLIRFYETGDPLEAAAFANVVASFSIEGIAATRIPVRNEVEEWLNARRQMGCPPPGME